MKLSIFLYILLIVAAAAVGPLLLIWAMNTLFGLNIAFTFVTWLAALIIGAAVSRK